MKEKIAKLIDVKSIMTLLLTVVFCVLALCGVITGQQFLTIFTMIVGFYFGTQSEKKSAAATYTGPQQSGTVDSKEIVEPMETVHPEATEDKLKPPNMEE